MDKKLEKLKKNIPELLELGILAKDVLSNLNLIRNEAKVAICFDISGTMHTSYTTGKIQKFVEKLLALACILDSNQIIDVFLFGDTPYYIGELSPKNIEYFFQENKGKYYSIGGTHFDKLIKKVCEFYFPSKSTDISAEVQKPIYVFIITDGNTVDEKKTEKELFQASYKPIFWQFAAMGTESKNPVEKLWKWVSKPMGDGFIFLEKMDNIEGRNIDNVGFFHIRSPFDISERQLYNLMMKEYPSWLEKAFERKLIK